jgi:hypothetical protein
VKATRAPPDVRFSAQIAPRRVRAGLVVAPEAVEHPLLAVRREPGSGVLDRDEHVVGVRLDRDRNDAVRRRVAHRVREQVA